MGTSTWRAITPKLLKSKAIAEPLYAAMRKLAPRIKADFHATTATWEEKPTFTATTNVSDKSNPKLRVTTKNLIYKFVDEGTKAHIIRPKKAKALRFQGTYTAKTVPGVIGSRGGGASGDFVLRQEVHHPGTEARRFTAIITKKWKPLFRQEMHRAMGDVAKASGHAIGRSKR